MKIFKYKWILVFLIAWLPAQGIAAAVLSVCVQENFSEHHDKAMMTTDNHHHDACHKQAADTPADHLIANLPCDDTSCDAYSSTPIVSDYTAPIPRNDTSAVSTSKSGFISFVPEQPQRPPLLVSL